jgi:hypothetical protein
MTDHDETDIDAIAVMPATPAADPLAVLGSLLALVTSAKQCERRVLELRREAATARAAQSELATGHATLAAERAALAQERSELATERADVEKRRLAVRAAEGMLSEREKRQAELEKAWAEIGEPAEVLSGFKDAELPALTKARRAHGFDPKPQDGTSDEAPRHENQPDPNFRDAMPPGATLARASSARPRSQRGAE